MRKLDFFVIGAVLLAALIVFLLFRPASGTTMQVSILSEGHEELISLPDTPFELTLESVYGKNILRLTPDGAEVVWADCASQACVRTGKITEPGRMIACLPNHLAISLIGEGEREVDAVAG